ncbi:MAG: flavodoxin family protein, partial [Candidatus Thorarchaeota archaeon]
CETTYIRERIGILDWRLYMKTAIIVYESVYGNTKRIAEVISEGINTVEGVECVIRKTGEIHTDDLCDYDAILLGGPNHNQEPPLNLVRFIERAAIVHLKAKIGAAFDTYTGGNRNVAVKKLESKMQEKLPGISVLGLLSAKVTGRKGPLADDEESRAREFGIEFGEKLLSD